MKINPIGIQSYEQIAHRDRKTPESTEQQINRAENKSVSIEAQDIKSGSALAVKAPSGNYADYLSPEEQKALDILFARFQETGRFGPSYNRENNAQAEKHVGRIIDLKV